VSGVTVALFGPIGSWELIALGAMALIVVLVVLVASRRR
jgi:hypothetical protein